MTTLEATIIDMSRIGAIISVALIVLIHYRAGAS